MYGVPLALVVVYCVVWCLLLKAKLGLNKWGRPSIPTLINGNKWVVHLLLTHFYAKSDTPPVRTFSRNGDRKAHEVLTPPPVVRT